MYKFTDVLVNRLRHYYDYYSIRKNRKVRTCRDCGKTIDAGEWAVEYTGDALFKMSGPRMCVDCSIVQGIIELA